MAGVNAEERGAAQIKSRERVRDLAEVYTHEREVNAMLDLVADMFPGDDDPGNIDRTFLEPACGSGNFLVEILARKLAYVTASRYGRDEGFEHCVLRCLASIYGVDICDENVEESRARMTALVCGHLTRHLGNQVPTPGFTSAIETILATNIVRGDTLAGAAEIELIEYEPERGGMFVRTWSRPLDPSASEPNLFSLGVERRDQAPVHYSELACQREPVSADHAWREAA